MKKGILVSLVAAVALLTAVSCGKSGSGDVAKAPVDVDLTILSSTMVYSQVYDMLTYPDRYIGKTVRMEGQFALYAGDGQNYYACLIADATACCSQGIEFVPADSLSYPQDFPELGSDICVVGVFDTYMEGKYQYCTLRNAQFSGIQ